MRGKCGGRPDNGNYVTVFSSRGAKRRGIQVHAFLSLATPASMSIECFKVFDAETQRAQRTAPR